MDVYGKSLAERPKKSRSGGPVIDRDGKITKTEARQFARLLLQIRKEAAKREAEQQVAQAVEIAAQTIHTFDLSRAKLPAIPFSTRIKSHKRKSRSYEVDLDGPTCSCPDFRSFRQKLPIGHLTRCCKHIFDASAQLEPVLSVLSQDPQSAADTMGC